MSSFAKKKALVEAASRTERGKYKQCTEEQKATRYICKDPQFPQRSPDSFKYFLPRNSLLLTSSSGFLFLLPTEPKLKRMPPRSLSFSEGQQVSSKCLNNSVIVSVLGRHGEDTSPSH